MIAKYILAEALLGINILFSWEKIKFVYLCVLKIKLQI